MTAATAEYQSAARERAFSMPIEQIDPSDPRLHADDTVGHYFARLRRDAPVHRSHSPLFGDFWSVTRYSALTRNTLPGKNDLFNAYNTEPDADGNVAITFSVEDPQDGSYWMPVNKGEPYYFVVRYYGPDLSDLPPSPLDN